MAFKRGLRRHIHYRQGASIDRSDVIRKLQSVRINFGTPQLTSINIWMGFSQHRRQDSKADVALQSFLLLQLFDETIFLVSSRMRFLSFFPLGKLVKRLEKAALRNLWP